MILHISKAETIDTAHIKSTQAGTGRLLLNVLSLQQDSESDSDSVRGEKKGGGLEKRTEKQCDSDIDSESRCGTAQLVTHSEQPEIAHESTARAGARD